MKASQVFAVLSLCVPVALSAPIAGVGNELQARAGDYSMIIYEDEKFKGQQKEFQNYQMGGCTTFKNDLAFWNDKVSSVRFINRETRFCIFFENVNCTGTGTKIDGDREKLYEKNDKFSSFKCLYEVPLEI